MIENWRRILVSDNYGVYRNWVNQRQACLAHLIRKASGLAQRTDERCRRFGEQLKEALQQLCAFAHAPPGKKKWTDFYTRLMLLLWFFEGAEDDAGRLSREILREIDTVGLSGRGRRGADQQPGRARAALWRAVAQTLQRHPKQKGQPLGGAAVSFRQTCRLGNQATFPLLVDTVQAYFKGQCAGRPAGSKG